MRKRIDGEEKRSAKGGRKRKKKKRKKERKKEKEKREKKWKTKGSRSPPQVEEASRDGRLDNTWDNDRPASLLGWKPSRIRDKDGDTLTPGINLSKDEAAVSVVNSGFQLLSRIYTHCCSPVTMPGRLIQWMGSRDGSSCLRDRSAATALDGRYATFHSRSIWKLVYSSKSVNIWVERVRVKVESIEVWWNQFSIIIFEIIALSINVSFVFQMRFQINSIHETPLDSLIYLSSYK